MDITPWTHEAKTCLVRRTGLCTRVAMIAVSEVYASFLPNNTIRDPQPASPTSEPHNQYV